MDVQAIAFPHGTALLWVRVGGLLDARFAHRPDEVVKRITAVPKGFVVETRDSTTGTVRRYDAERCFVSRVEWSSGGALTASGSPSSTMAPLAPS